MPSIAVTDVERMRDELLFDGPRRSRKLSRFWTLLILATFIATAGVIGDSTATVIGAMIVAPLMTPILGTVYSIVTTDRANLYRSLFLVVAGAASVVAIAWLFGHLYRLPVVAQTNSQVASRVKPHLVDLAAALATGAVGAFAMVRDDVSDTLPGVAIAISLVPPLAVVGLTLESHAPHQAAGALLLFVTNVVAILISGVIVMAIYRVHVVAAAAGGPPTVAEDGSVPVAGVSRQAAIVTVVVLLLIISVPLAITGVDITKASITTAKVTTVATAWARRAGWHLLAIDEEPDGMIVRVTGSPPDPDPAALRRDLDAAGLSSVDVQLTMVPSTVVDLPPG
jgi:uncharacterized hydrophobic protein (TIGR00271 family)